MPPIWAFEGGQCKSLPDGGTTYGRAWVDGEE